MEHQLEKLNNLNLDADLFYAITIYPQSIKMQGKMSSDLISVLKRKGFSMLELCEANNFLEFSDNNGIYVTLT
jgi:hypothetical protein